MDINLLKEVILGLVQNDFYKYQNYLLKNSIYERSITHQLAMHLRNIPLFDGYHIDCEYDGYTKPPYSKIINTIEQEYKDDLEKKLNELKSKKPAKLNNGEYNILNTPEGYRFISRVFPDIIIHKRGTNEKNLCIIEVKTSVVNRFKKHDKLDKYDLLKLKKYVDSSDLGYTLGVFIELEKGYGLSRFSLTFFEKDMEKVEKEYKYNM